MQHCFLSEESPFPCIQMFPGTQREIVSGLSFSPLRIQERPTNQCFFPLIEFATTGQRRHVVSLLLPDCSGAKAPSWPWALCKGSHPAQPCQQELEPERLQKANTTSAIAESTPIHFKIPANICEQCFVAFVQVPSAIKLGFKIRRGSRWILSCREVTTCWQHGENDDCRMKHSLGTNRD